MSSSVRKTDAEAIYQEVKAIKAEQERQETACLAAIKAVRAAGPSWVIEDVQAFECQIRRGMIGEKSYAVAKFSPNGKLIGWFKKDQIRGRPNRRMPIERELDAMLDAYLNEYKKLIDEAGRQTYRCQKSRQARAQSDNLLKKITRMYTKLVEAGVKKSARVKTIARHLDCEPEYVRRVLRKSSLV